MKVTNLSTTKTLYFTDLKLIRQSLTEANPTEEFYLSPSTSKYLPNTSEVIRSAYKGHLRKWADAGLISLEDVVEIESGNDYDIVHNLYVAPGVYILKQVGETWVDATGTVDIVHNAAFTTVTITNVSGSDLTFLIRLL